MRSIFRTSSLREWNCQLSSIWKQVVAMTLPGLAQFLVVSRHLASNARWWAYLSLFFRSIHRILASIQLHKDITDPVSETRRLLSSMLAIHGYKVCLCCIIIYGIAEKMVFMPGFLRGLVSTDFKGRFQGHQTRSHRIIRQGHFTPSQ